MPIDILMPALSPTMEEGKLAKWLVKEGDKVASGDILAEIETDKATMEFEAIDEGVVGRILVAEGSEGVKVNAPIAVLLEEGESASEITDTAPEKAAKDTVDKGAVDKGNGAANPAIANSAGANGASPAPPSQANAQMGAREKAEGGRIFASPLARRLAREKGIDLANLQGSGPHGRIIRADIEAAKPGQRSQIAGATATAPPPSQSSEALAKIYHDRDYEEVALDGMRKTVAARLTEAKQNVPHFYLRREIELDALLALRAAMNTGLEAQNIKLSVNDFIIKASARALQSVPDCNVIWAGDRMFRMKASDVAIAVAVEGGLFTPVIKDAETKSLAVLSGEMKDLATRARTRKLAPHEYLGGSFAISNLGMFGVENFDAVINPPHGSILAVGAGIQKPIIKKGEITHATMMSVTLSTDHRVIDGALGAQFLEAIKRDLENPAAMLA